VGLTVIQVEQDRRRRRPPAVAIRTISERPTA